MRTPAGEPAPSLPDTFVERAIQVARANPGEPAVYVMLNVFEASYIRQKYAEHNPAKLVGAPDVSLAATPASDDLRNALQVLDAHQVLLPVGRALTLLEAGTAVRDLLDDSAAVARLLRQALTKLEQGAR